MKRSVKNTARRAALLDNLKLAIERTDNEEKKREWQAEYDRQVAKDKQNQSYVLKILQDLREALNEVRWFALFCGAVLLLVFAFLMISRPSYRWEGEGMVNLFPTDATAKNYRVPAQIEVDQRTRGLFGKISRYRIMYVTWPNGGTTYFEECKIIPLEDKDSCTDNDLRDWRVEVQEEPDTP